MSAQTEFTLTQADIPQQWYNLLADFPEPLPPPLHPGTKQPVPPEALLAIFPENGPTGDVARALAGGSGGSARRLPAVAADTGLIEAEAYHQTKVFEAGTLFARTEGIVPAPESAHAIASVVEEAGRARDSGHKRVILFNLSGHGLLDLSAYESYFTGKLQDV